MNNKVYLVTTETNDHMVSEELQTRIQLQDELVGNLHQKLLKLKVQKINTTLIYTSIVLLKLKTI